MWMIYGVGWRVWSTCSFTWPASLELHYWNKQKLMMLIESITRTSPCASLSSLLPCSGGMAYLQTKEKHNITLVEGVYYWLHQRKEISHLQRHQQGVQHFILNLLSSIFIISLLSLFPHLFPIIKQIQTSFTLIFFRISHKCITHSLKILPDFYISDVTPTVSSTGDDLQGIGRFGGNLQH